MPRSLMVGFWRDYHPKQPLMSRIKKTDCKKSDEEGKAEAESH